MIIKATTPVSSLYEYIEYTYRARGCAYVFAIQDDGHAVVEAIARNGSTKWEARIDVDHAATVLDIVRDARRSI